LRWVLLLYWLRASWLKWGFKGASRGSLASSPHPACNPTSICLLSHHSGCMINYPVQGPLVIESAGQLNPVEQQVSRCSVSSARSSQCGLYSTANQFAQPRCFIVCMHSAVCAVDNPHPSLIFCDPTPSQCSIVTLMNRAEWKYDPP